MTLLFALASPEYLRFYDTTIRMLAERGHDVVIAVHAIRAGKPVQLGPFEQPTIRVDGVLPARADGWTEMARGIRGTMDFVRYLHPQLASAASLRARMKRQALPWTLQLLDRVRSLPAGAVNGLMGGLAAIERAIPVDRTLVEYLDSRKPDVLLVSPLVEAASDQVDVVRAAQSLGIPVVALVASWDNLTNKGDLRVQTDLVAVWNEAQKREAVEFHRIDPATVAVTGAQVFDRWFGRKPTRDRETFCRDVGLPPGKPFVLYTGSSIFISRAEAEVPFVHRWIAGLRASADPAIREIAVLVRPHPYNGSAWPAVDFAGLGDVAVWPRGGYNPVDEANRDGFFDSLYHSAAIVGINTSAMIEAAVVGRPVFSILDPAFATSQEGTLHFRHLLAENGGCVRVATTLEEHAEQLAAVLRDPVPVREQIERFVRSFVRPQGLDRPSLPILVDAIERQAGTAPAPVRTGPGARLLRAVMAPLAWPAWLWSAPARRKQSRARRTRNPQHVPRIVAAVALLPVLAGTVAAAGFITAELAGGRPFAYTAPANIAEAAGMEMTLDLVRMLREGQDPTQPMRVGPDVISSDITVVSALEAAVWTRSERLIRLFRREGYLGTEADRRHIACVATAIGAENIASDLAPNGGAGCNPEETIQQIRARAE